jgi:hypothetical protein
MNILPVVFGFIFIFSLLTLGLIQGQYHAVLAEKCFKSYHTLSRLSSNAVAKKLYDRIKTSPPPADPSKPPSTEPSQKPHKTSSRSKREYFPPLESSKFNLLPLLELKTDPKNHPLYEICAELLRFLYEEPLFKPHRKEGIEYDLLNAMIKMFRSKADSKVLSDFYPEAPDLRQIFYKMLKGTNQYNVENHLGIAPLEDFILLDKSTSIRFSFASAPLLHAIFGKKIALNIFTAEKKKREEGKPGSLTKDELTALLSSDTARSSLILELEEHIDFTQKYPKRTTLSKRDKGNGLVVKKKIT